MFLHSLQRKEAGVRAFGDRLGQAVQMRGRGFQALGRRPWVSPKSQQHDAGFGYARPETAGRPLSQANR